MPMRPPPVSVPPSVFRALPGISQAATQPLPPAANAFQAAPEQLPLHTLGQNGPQVSAVGPDHMPDYAADAVDVAPRQRGAPAQVGMPGQPLQALTGDSRNQVQTQAAGIMGNGLGQPLTGDSRKQRQGPGIVNVDPEPASREPLLLTGDNHGAASRNAAKERSLRARRQGTIELAPLAINQQDGAAEPAEMHIHPAEPVPPTSLMTTMSTDSDGAYVHERAPAGLQGSTMMYTNPLSGVPASPSSSYPGSPVPFQPLGITPPRPGRIGEIQPFQQASQPDIEVVAPAVMEPEPFPTQPAGVAAGQQQQPEADSSAAASGPDAPAVPRKLTKRRRELMRHVFAEWRELSTAAATHTFYHGMRGSTPRHGKHVGDNTCHHL